MQLNCTPAINLFPQAQRPGQPRGGARPSTWSCRTACGRSITRCSRSTAMEGFPADGGPTQPFLPFYAANDLSRNPGHRSYYMLRRQPHLLSSRVAAAGAAVELSRARRVHLAGRCRQRAGRRTRCASSGSTCCAPTATCRCRCRSARSTPISRSWSTRRSPRSAAWSGPTAPRPCRGDGDYAWRFISHLGLNYLSLTDTDCGAGRGGAARAAAAVCAAQRHAGGAAARGPAVGQPQPVVRRIPGAGPSAPGAGCRCA